ncbi:MAG: acyl carrier protein [Bacteroidota bacterium]
MEKEIIVSKLTAIFRDIFNNENLVLTREMTANDVEDWSSLTHVLMIKQVESVFAIKISLKELNKLKNVGVLIDLIESKTL